ncbi:MAG: flagellar hook protein FlgE [Herminiimonas sp.]|nr:flagellar hook protein FlgE [Herminiimonas sp.]
MGFQQGLSGLKAASKSLEAIGNNVANAQTVGFKSSQAQFADVYASSLNGSGSSTTGIGVKVADIAQQFTQGNVTASNSPLDLAINGNGFFRMSNNGTVTYGRNGQFKLDENGFISNAGGAHLTGYAVDANGVLSTGAPADLRIVTTDLSPKATTSVKAGLNLDSRITAPVAPLTRPTFSVSDPTSYDNATSVSVFDSLGNAHVLQTFFVKSATAGTWDIYAASDGVAIGTAPVGQLAFSSGGVLTTPMPLTPPVSIVLTNGATTPLKIPLDFTGTTQFGANFSVNKLAQDGFTSGRLSGFNIGADGTLVGRYTNGESSTLGQVVLASFANPNGLQPLGGNAWAESSTSGQPLVNRPGSGSLGVLQSSAVEDSNVDLTAELVNMITAQRYYQANSQTIKTEDQVLQTLINLR